MKHLFIVTYGRTGSTLLMNLINQAPTVRIYGENRNYLYGLYQQLRLVDEWREFGGGDAPTSPWYGAAAIDHDALRDEILATARNFFRRHYPEDYATCAIIGFKEIRYLVPDLNEYLDFLAAQFENAHFIFLLRDPDDVLVSGFFRDREPGYYRAAIEKFHHEAELFATKDNPSAATILWYADLVTDAAGTRAALEKLGIGISAASYAAALSVPVSYDRKSIVETTPGLAIWRNERNLKQHDIIFRLVAKDWGEVRGIGNIVLEGAVLAGEDRAATRVTLTRNGEAVAATPVKLAVPQMKQAYPRHPNSGSSGFRINYALGAGGTASYALIAAIDGIGDVELARLSFVAAPKEAPRP